MAELALRQLWEAVQKWPNSLHVFICLKLMVTVWGRLLFKMSDLVVYSPPGGNFWLLSMHESFVLSFTPPPHPTQVLEDQGDIQSSRTGKEGVFPDTGEYRICRECSAPTSVTTKEGGLHVRSVGTGITYQLTRIGCRIIRG